MPRPRRIPRHRLVADLLRASERADLGTTARAALVLAAAEVSRCVIRDRCAPAAAKALTDAVEAAAGLLDREVH